MKKENLYNKMRKYERIAGISMFISAIFFIIGCLNVLYIYAEDINGIGLLMAIIPVIIGLISSSIYFKFEEKSLILHRKLFRETLKELG